MKLIISLLICILASVPSTYASWVNAKEGLIMREYPELGSKRITTIPYGEEVFLLEEIGDEITISNATGKWCIVQWQDKKGWVFGGFLCEYDPHLNDELTISELIGYWDYDKIGTGMGFSFIDQENIKVGEYKSVGKWSLKDNTIVINLTYVTDNWDDNTFVDKEFWIRLEILEYKPNYLKLSRTDSDLGPKVIELYQLTNKIITEPY
jgi:hypothetical protein